MSNNEADFRKVSLSLIIIIFIWTGSMKLMSSPQEIMLFAKWGYPLWFMYLTGVWDILFAIGLNIKQTSRISAIGLILLLCTDVVTPPC